MALMRPDRLEHVSGAGGDGGAKGGGGLRGGEGLGAIGGNDGSGEGANGGDGMAGGTAHTRRSDDAHMTPPSSKQMRVTPLLSFVAKYKPQSWTDALS